MIEGGGEDQFRALLDHVLHGGGRAGFIGHVLSFDDLDAIDVGFDLHDGFVHGLVIARIGDGTAVQRADDQAGSCRFGRDFRGSLGGGFGWRATGSAVGASVGCGGTQALNNSAAQTRMVERANNSFLFIFFSFIEFGLTDGSDK